MTLIHAFSVKSLKFVASEPKSITELTSHLFDVCYQCIPRVDYTVAVRDCISDHGL